MAVPLPLHSTLAFEMIDQWKRLIDARADDRDRIGQAVYNVLEEAVECVRQSNDWLSAARCCDWGFAACQCDPTEAAVASGLTGQLRDLHFPKATVEFHRGVFLVGQSNLESAIEYFRMSARDFTHSQVLAPHSSSANGDIAAVMIIRQGDDDHATLKKYYREKDHWLLRPMNARYKPIVVVARDDRERIVREYARRNMDVEMKVDATVYVVGRVVAIWRAMG